ncbi:hypothetical protein, partial [Stenotrophomonas sp. SrG]|uniref:hypothetical protein n=1 Tax=Stenotrophomonas sp. SrG TaxID=3414430 RepID=UPI003CF4AA2A
MAQVIDAREDSKALYGDGIDSLAGQTQEATDAMSTFADQAARTWLRSVADGLCGRCEDGVEGWGWGVSDARARRA